MLNRGDHLKKLFRKIFGLHLPRNGVKKYTRLGDNDSPQNTNGENHAGTDQKSGSDGGKIGVSLPDTAQNTIEWRKKDGQSECQKNRFCKGPKHCYKNGREEAEQEKETDPHCLSSHMNPLHLLLLLGKK